MLKSNNIDTIYKSLCKKLLKSKQQVNGTHELNNVKITLTDVENAIVTNRNISLSYMCGELLWYFHGSNDVEFISKFASMWRKLSDDTFTNNSAYGFILKYKYKFDQVEKIIELLKRDKYSRRAVININVPNENVIKTKDEPCTICLQFLIRNNKLNCTSIMRSNDIWLGFPYDITFFTTLQKYIAIRLNVKCGILTHFVTSMHLYDKDIPKMKLRKSGKHYSINVMNLINSENYIYNKIMISDKPKELILDMFESFNILNIS